MMNTRSLRFQLGVWYAGLLSGVFVLLGFATIVVLRHYLEAQIRDSHLRRVHQMAQALSPAMVQKGPRAVGEEIEARFSPSSNNRFARVRRLDGTVVYVSAAPEDRSFHPETVPFMPWPKGRMSADKIALANGVNMSVASYALRPANGTALLIEYGASLSGVQTVVRQAAVAMVVTLLLAIAVAVAGGLFLVRRALTVVDGISRSAERISLHNLTERLPIARTGDEIESLSVALNTMIQRLDEAFQHSKRFVADASHELRTPLTVLRGELETLIEHEQLVPEVRERLGSVLEEVERLAKLVEGLLTLSRLDAGEAHAESVEVDLGQLTASTADQMSLLGADKNISIRCDSPGDVVVRGDRTRLKQIIVNLLDNAIKYTPPGGTVRLEVSAKDGRAILEVVDNGIGIPAEALSHVFERFYRVDSTRSRDLGGAGLGLSIAKAIGHAHGGELFVQSAVGGGSRFRLDLPLTRLPSEPHTDPSTPPAKELSRV